MFGPAASEGETSQIPGPSNNKPDRAMEAIIENNSEERGALDGHSVLVRLMAKSRAGGLARGTLDGHGMIQRGRPPARPAGLPVSLIFRRLATDSLHRGGQFRAKICTVATCRILRRLTFVGGPAETGSQSNNKPCVGGK